MLDLQDWRQELCHTAHHLEFHVWVRNAEEAIFKLWEQVLPFAPLVQTCWASMRP